MKNRLRVDCDGQWKQSIVIYRHEVKNLLHYYRILSFLFIPSKQSNIFCIYSKGIKSDTNSGKNLKFKNGIEIKEIETNHNSATHQFMEETPKFRNATVTERRRRQDFEKWLKMALYTSFSVVFYC
jgi:hypothetical protein